MGTRARQLADKPLKIVFGGVCREEVEAFVAVAAADYHAVLADVERLRGELAEVTATLVTAHANERETTRTISRAENDARAIRDAAERQGADLQRAAEEKATSLLRDLEAEREQINRQINRCAESRARLTRLLQTEIDELGLLITSERQSPAEANFAASRPATLRPVAEPVPAYAAAAPQSAAAMPPPPAASVLELSPEPLTYKPASLEEHPDDTPVKRLDEAWSAEDVESALRALIDTIPQVEETDGNAAVSSAPPIETVSGEEIHGIAADPRYAVATADDSFDTREGPEPAPKRRLPRLALGAGILAAVVTVAVLAFPRAETDAATPDESAPVPPSPTRAASSVPLTPPPTTTPETTTSPAAPSNKLVVRMQATRPCWIGVAIGDEKENRLLGQGEEITRESASDLVLRVGDAGALAVTVNDRRLPPLGADGEVVTRRFSTN